jgi:Domain of unknown function (DUF151)
MVVWSCSIGAQYTGSLHLPEAHLNMVWYSTLRGRERWVKGTERHQIGRCMVSNQLSSNHNNIRRRYVMMRAFEGGVLCRPSAYDATSELLKSLKCKVERILITECTNTIFYSRVYAVNSSSGHHVDVDARPSDAINLALRHNARVFVNKSVARQFAK